MNADVLRRPRALLAIGGAALLGGLLLLAPAPLLTQWLKSADTPPAIQLLGVEGVLLRGSASAIAVNGRPALSGLRWELNPVWLLLANVSAQVRAQAEQSVLETRLSLWPGGRINASDLNFSGSIKALLAAAGQPYLPLDGMVRIADGQIGLKRSWPHSAQGLVQVQGLAWTLAATPIALGDFEAEISTGDEAVLAKMISTAGPLELKGEAQLRPDQSYLLDLAYRPRPEATPVLRNLLASNGAADADGWYHIRQQRQAPAPTP